jgi:hypothetical protein
MGSKLKPSDKRRDNDADERKMAWAKGLRSRYAKVAKEPVPNSFRDLLERIEDAESRKRRRATG